MKKISSYLMMGIFLVGIILISSCKCNKCKDIVELADLGVRSIEDAQRDSSNQVIFDVAHTVINIIGDVACPDEIESTGSHKNLLSILFSETGKVAVWDTVSSKTVDGKSLAAGQTYVMDSEVEFLEDGFYEIVHTLDVNNQVTERSKSNNFGRSAVGGRLSYPTSETGTSSSVIIEVRGTNNEHTYDENGDIVYVKNWNVTVR